MLIRLATAGDLTITEGTFSCHSEAIRSAIDLALPLHGLRLPNQRISHVDFARQKMTGHDFSQSSFYSCNFGGADLSQGSWYKAVAVECDFREASLESCNADWLTIVGGQVDGLKLKGTRIDRLRILDAYGAPEYAGAILDDEELTAAPIYIDGLRWPICITAQRIRIFCQSHTHEAWGDFNRAEISAMVNEAGVWNWWNANREYLLSLAASHRAKSNG